MKNLISILLPMVLISSCATKQEGDVEASVFFIKSDFKPFSLFNISTQNFISNTEAHTIKINDIRKSNLQPTLEKNGIQFEDFRKSNQVLNLLDAVRKTVAQELDDEQRKNALQEVLNPFEEHLKEWAVKNLPSTSFDEVVCGRGFYRNTDAYARVRALGAMQLEIAHIDFYPGQDLANLFEITGFKDSLVRKYGDEARQVNFWQNHGLQKMINVWMPMAMVLAYPLAVLDTQTFIFEDDIIPNLSRVQGIAKDFQSGALRYKTGLQFYYKSKLDKGEAVIFNSFKTPHTAFAMPNQTSDRESFDIRCAFIKRLNR